MKKPGYKVKTKSGKIGRTNHSDQNVDGKVLVYCDDGSKILCKIDSLKLIGFID